MSSTAKSRGARRFKARENSWTYFNTGSVRGIEHCELVCVRSKPGQLIQINRVGVFKLSRFLVWWICLGTAVLLCVLLAGCRGPRPQKGGQASNSLVRPGRTNVTTMQQAENPKEPSRQTVVSQQEFEYVLPEGTALGLPPAGPPITAASNNAALLASGPMAILSKPTPVRYTATDRTETTLGAVHKDTAREWAAKAASLQPVMWAGIAMMTLVAGLFAYFGWWTKAGLAAAVGVAMIVLAQTLPDSGMLIFLGGLGVFILSALLVLYSYYKGQLDQNHNGIPDFLERGGSAQGKT